MGKKRQVPIRERSLVCFLQALVGTLVEVECRDDVAMRGTLEECDDCMNCTLLDASRITSEGERLSMERVFIRNRLIRFVHFSPGVDPSALIEKQRDDWYEASRFYQRQVVFGPRHLHKGAIDANNSDALPGALGVSSSHAAADFEFNLLDGDDT